MRIQHNIPAMSSYRNYTANTSAVAKSLEKLSSGYKINRAGDDAAGLAISEKMRAQITGLETAQKNAKDGISLVQTAEGALTEVHDMLNRMYELAEQSANGTYSDDVDREQLQKEVDSLRSEINRIADSSNFNGIKLLDGSLDGEDKYKVNDTTFSGMKYSFRTSPNGPGGQSATVNTDQGVKFFTHQEGVAASKTSFEVDLSNLGVSDLGDAGQVKFELGLAKDGNSTWLTDSNNHKLDSANDDITVVGGVDATSEWSATITADSNGKVDGAKLASELVKALGDKTTVQIDGVEYNVTADGSTLKFQMTDAGFTTAAANDKFGGNFNIGVKASTSSDGGTTWDGAANITGMTDNSTSNIHQGNVAKGTQLADLVVRAYSNPQSIRDGSGIKLGNDYYVFAGTDETLNAKYSGDVKVIDIRDIFNADDNELKTTEIGGVSDGGVTNIKEALTRLTEAAADNDMWSVELSNNGNTICLREKESYSGDADLSTLKGLKEQVQKFTKAEANVDVTKATGKALTLQIGDTAESFNKMSVNVADCHAAAMGIGDIDISTQDGASTAMDAIKSAINYVSDTRGGLGALQNRLDHTINNLGVQQQNIQDAESTIRDVDVAKEMMEYTKNNILVQSAQAMLAQANQLPQGVLQLLG